MREQWTAEIIGAMHLHEINQMQLAKQLGVTAEYVNMVLNGRRNPKGANKRFQVALSELIKKAG